MKKSFQVVDFQSFLDRISLSKFSLTRKSLGSLKGFIEIFSERIEEVDFREELEIDGHDVVFDSDVILNKLSSFENEQNLFIVLFSSFETGYCYKISIEDFIEFGKWHREHIKYSDFMDPFDHVFYLEDFQKLIYLHVSVKLFIADLEK